VEPEHLTDYLLALWHRAESSARVTGGSADLSGREQKPHDAPPVHHSPVFTGV